MAPAIIFAFGPDNAYFFYCHGTVIHENCSWAFRETVLKKLERPYFVSLGPGENEYCAFYESKTGEQCHSINYPHTPNLQGIGHFFSSHIKAAPSSLQSAHIGIGPEGTQLACTREGIWNTDLIPRKVNETIFARLVIEKTEPRPEGLRYTYAKAKSVLPSQASFGKNGEWFIRWTDGLCAWDLTPGLPLSEKIPHTRSAYPGLRDLLGSDTSETASEDRRKCINYLVFDMWSDRNWFCVLDSGYRIEFSLPMGVASKLQPVLNQYLDGIRTVGTLTTIQPQQTSPTSTEKLVQTESYNNATDIDSCPQYQVRRIRVAGASELPGETPPAYQAETPGINQREPGHGGFWRRFLRGSG